MSAPDVPPMSAEEAIDARDARDAELADRLRRRLMLTVRFEDLPRWLGLERELVKGVTVDDRFETLRVHVLSDTAEPIPPGSEAPAFELAFPRLFRVDTLDLVEELERRIEALIDAESRIGGDVDVQRPSLSMALDSVGELRILLDLEDAVSGSAT